MNEQELFINYYFRNHLPSDYLNSTPQEQYAALLRVQEEMIKTAKNHPNGFNLYGDSSHVDYKFRNTTKTSTEVGPDDVLELNKFLIDKVNVMYQAFKANGGSATGNTLNYGSKSVETGSIKNALLGRTSTQTPEELEAQALAFTLRADMKIGRETSWFDGTESDLGRAKRSYVLAMDRKAQSESDPVKKQDYMIMANRVNKLETIEDVLAAVESGSTNIATSASNINSQVDSSEEKAAEPVQNAVEEKAETKSITASGGPKAKAASTGHPLDGLSLDEVKKVQTWINEYYKDDRLGKSGPNKNGVDGSAGKNTKAAFDELVSKEGYNLDQMLGRPPQSTDQPRSPLDDYATYNTPAPVAPRTGQPPVEEDAPTDQPPAETEMTKLMKEMLDAYNKGDLKRMGSYATGMARDIGRLAMGMKGMNEEIPDYVPSKYFDEMVSASRRMVEQGIPQTQENYMQMLSERGLHLAMGEAKRAAAGSAGAVMGNTRLAVKDYYAQIANLANVDLAAKLQATPAYMQALQTGENIYQGIYNQKREQKLAARSAAAGLVNDSLISMNNREQFDNYFGPNSLNALKTKFGLIRADQRYDELAQANQKMGAMVENTSTLESDPSVMGHFDALRAETQMGRQREETRIGE